MTTRVTQIVGSAALSIAAAATSLAEIKVNDNLAFSGYLVGSATINKVQSDTTVGTMDMDAMKLVATAKFAPKLSGTASIWSGSNATPVFLDAYATYDLGNGLTLTGGKFLSWLGYEAFDPINMTQITYAWQSNGTGGSLIGIPAYHTGVKLETTGDGYTAGIAVLDSNRYDTPVYKGDGRIDHGIGLEAYTNLKSGNFTTFIGVAYDKNDFADVAVYSGNVWVQYVEGANTFAAEISYAISDPQLGDSTSTYFGQLFAKHNFSETFALSGRLAYGVIENDGLSTTPPFRVEDYSYTKLTVAPAWTLTSNLDVVSEVSYTIYDGRSYDNSVFVGVQARFKF